jgi:hypothetical protein
MPYGLLAQPKHQFLIHIVHWRHCSHWVYSARGTLKHVDRTFGKFGSLSFLTIPILFRKYRCVIVGISMSIAPMSTVKTTAVPAGDEESTWRNQRYGEKCGSEREQGQRSF